MKSTREKAIDYLNSIIHTAGLIIEDVNVNKIPDGYEDNLLEELAKIDCYLEDIESYLEDPIP